MKEETKLGFLKFNIQLFADGEGEGGEGNQDQNPSNGQQANSNEPNANGSQEKTLDFAGIQINTSDKNLENVHKSYIHMQSEYTKMRDKVAQYEKAQQNKQDQNNAQNNQNQKQNNQSQDDGKLDFLMKSVIQDKFELQMNKRVDEFKQTRPELYAVAEKGFNEIVKNFSLEQKQQFIDGFNEGKNDIVTSALQYAYSQEAFKSDFDITKYTNVKDMANNKEVQDQVMAQKLNQFQQQEKLPNGMPNGGDPSTSKPDSLLDREPLNLDEAYKRGQLRRQANQQK